MSDIYGFSACLILIGMLSFPAMEDPRISLGTKVNTIMSSNLCSFISKFLDIVENEKIENTILFKLYCLAIIINSWKRYYFPRKELSL